MRGFTRMMASDDGSSAAEYALVVAIVGSLIALGSMNLGAAITASVGAASTDVETCAGQC